MPSVESFCTILGAGLVCMIGSGIVAEFGYRSVKYFTEHDELDEVPLNQYDVIDLRKYESAAVFLFNHTVDAHHEFLHDVKVANARHPVAVFQLDCVDHRSICGTLGHGQMHEYEEPPVLFYHKGEWSESYHDDIQTKKVPKPESRRQRVKTIVKWLDNAHGRGSKKIFDREMYLNNLRAMESPSQRMMREHRENMAKKDSKTQGAGDNEKKVEL